MDPIAKPMYSENGVVDDDMFLSGDENVEPSFGSGAQL